MLIVGGESHLTVSPTFQSQTNLPAASLLHSGVLRAAEIWLFWGHPDPTSGAYTVLSGSYFTLLNILLQASKSPVKDCKQREGNFAVLNLSLEPALLRPQVGTESLPCCVITGSAYHYSLDTDGRILMVLALLAMGKV
jgi:hypothetical protein